MGITVNKEHAEARLREAVAWASDPDRTVPDEWVVTTERVGESASKTLVAMLGTGLLARSVDERVDPLSIKASYSETTYSARTLCHSVLVPISREDGCSFDLGANGREPLNNQPFFRYDHMSEVDRTKVPEDLAYLCDRLGMLADVACDEALAGLAAFIRTRRYIRARRVEVVDTGLMPRHASVAALHSMLRRFLEGEITDRPLRLQAIVGGLIRSAGAEVSTQALNDPSRHAPGDVHVPDARQPHWVVEVRGKRVLQHEAQAFVDACAATDTVRSCWIVAISGAHQPLDRSSLAQAGCSSGPMVVVIEDLLELIGAFAAHPAVAPDALDRASNGILAQLAAVEAGYETLADWRNLCIEAKGSEADVLARPSKG